MQYWGKVLKYRIPQCGEKTIFQDLDPYAMQDAVGSPFQIEDVDLFERQWSVFITVERGSHFEVSVHAPRGVGFFPLFNRAKDMEVKAIQYGE